MVDCRDSYIFAIAVSGCVIGCHSPHVVFNKDFKRDLVGHISLLYRMTLVNIPWLG